MQKKKPLLRGQMEGAPREVYDPSSQEKMFDNFFFPAKMLEMSPGEWCGDENLGFKCLSCPSSVVCRPSSVVRHLYLLSSHVSTLVHRISNFTLRSIHQYFLLYRTSDLQ